MKKNMLFILKISRPKFWLYLAGTYFLGYTLGAPSLNELSSPQFGIFFFYFLIPANIFLYGVNDYYDHDTDIYNKRKSDEEYRLRITDKKLIRITLYTIIGMTLFIIMNETNSGVKLLLALFLLLAYAYSGPPLRLKSKPVVDSLSNVLYIIPGIIGYYQQSQQITNIFIIVACSFWSFAMHLFSAIPDRDADRKAGLTTTAVLFGEKTSLLLCSFLWFCFFILIAYYLSFTVISYLLIVYPILPLLVLHYTIPVHKIYTIYPYLNSFIGFVFVLYFLLQKM